MMKLILRVDATTRTGTGHLMRCLALAQGIKDRGGEVVVITYCESEGLINRLKKENFRIHLLNNADSLKESLAIVRQEKPDWIVLDGYHFDTEYQKAVKDASDRFLYIDDYAHLDHYYADIILNQNYGAETFRYKTEPYAQVLAGARYALLRREFLEYAGFNREFSDTAHNILITMGGADPDNYTSKILEAINLIDIVLNVRVILGANNVHWESVGLLAGKSRHNVEVLNAVENMAPYMDWADVAVSAGGSTVWELAFMGLPSLLCIIAANHEWYVNFLAQDGVFPSAGWIQDKSPYEISDMIHTILTDKNIRHKMSDRAKSVVDGLGITRVIIPLESLSHSSAILHGDVDFDEIKFKNFVNLTDEEAAMVRVWRNSDEIRKWMFTDHVISNEEHLRFIEDLRNDSMNCYWMVTIRERPVGVVSFQKIDFKKKSGHLGIYTVEKGHGAQIINHLLHLWFEQMNMVILKCALFKNNDRAFNFYRHAGFTEDANFETGRVEEGTRRKVISMSLRREDFAMRMKKAHAAEI